VYAGLRLLRRVRLFFGDYDPVPYAPGWAAGWARIKPGDLKPEKAVKAALGWLEAQGAIKRAAEDVRIGLWRTPGWLPGDGR
jgi:hypothetical protein